MTNGWKQWRPAIWLAMIGVAVLIVISPWYLAAIPFGAALGSALRIRQRNRRAR